MITITAGPAGVGALLSYSTTGVGVVTMVDGVLALGDTDIAHGDGAVVITDTDTQVIMAIIGAFMEHGALLTDTITGLTTSTTVEEIMLTIVLDVVITQIQLPETTLILL